LAIVIRTGLVSNAVSGDGFFKSFSDAFPTSVDSWYISEFIAAVGDVRLTVCVSYNMLLCQPLETRGTYLFQEYGHDDEGHTEIRSDNETWQKVRIFGPERMREEVGPTILRL
jgi:hypothetical protein